MLSLHDESADCDWGWGGDCLSSGSSDCEYGVYPVSSYLSFSSDGADFFNFGGVAWRGGSGGGCAGKGFHEKEGCAGFVGAARYFGAGD